MADMAALAEETKAAGGVPPSPAGWIITTARNRAIDRLRREASSEDRHAQAALLHARDHLSESAQEGPVRDERLRLGSATGRTGCHLPRLQRGVRRQFRRGAGPRGPLRGGDSARSPVSRADARRAGGAGLAGADAAQRGASGCPDHVGRLSGAPGRPGPQPLAPWAHRRGALPSCERVFGGASQARTRSRRRSTPCTVTLRARPARTGGRSCGSTTNSWRSHRRARPRQLLPVPCDPRRSPPAAWPPRRRLGGLRHSDRPDRQRDRGRLPAVAPSGAPGLTTRPVCVRLTDVSRIANLVVIT